MEFFKKFLAENQQQCESAENVHPDFRRTEDGFWFFNRGYSSDEALPSLKAIYKFDDANLLDNCPFMAKIGMNEADGPKYFGLAYGSEANRTELEEWSKRFPWAHLLVGLDNNGVMTEKSEEIDLKAI